jgi:hypothetical protein
MGKEDAYAIDYYRHSQENLNVASINNHITSEYAGVTTGGKGMAVAMNTDVNSNFAFCPFKMVYLPETGEFRIRANPFGTYSGAQILPPTRGNRLGFEAVLLSTPHFQSAGPTYNGYHDRFDLMLAFFDGDSIPDDVKRDLITFARPPVVFGSHLLEKRIERSQTGLPPAGFLALPYEDGILFHWEQTGAPGTEYRIRCMTLPEIEEKSFSVKETTLFVGPADLDTMRSTEGLYVATIEALHTNGQTSKRSPEIRFRLTPTSDQKPKIPNDFKAKILWANISAWIQRNLL